MAKWSGSASPKKERECKLIEKAQNPERSGLNSKLFCFMSSVTLTNLHKISVALVFYIIHNEDNTILPYKILIKIIR